jgi:hypothetical protein
VEVARVCVCVGGVFLEGCILQVHVWCGRVALCVAIVWCGCVHAETRERKKQSVCCDSVRSACCHHCHHGHHLPPLYHCHVMHVSLHCRHCDHGRFRRPEELNFKHTHTTHTRTGPLFFQRTKTRSSCTYVLLSPVQYRKVLKKALRAIKTNSAHHCFKSCGLLDFSTTSL